MAVFTPVSQRCQENSKKLVFEKENNQKNPKTKTKSYLKRLKFITVQDICCILLDHFNTDLFVTSVLCLLVCCIFP